MNMIASVADRWASTNPTVDEAFLDSMLNESEGRFARRRRGPSPDVWAKEAKLIRLIQEAKYDDYASLRLREVMSTSDFPLLFGDILDRQVMGMYKDWPVTWDQYIKRATVRDFRDVRRILVDGMTDRWDKVEHRTPELTTPRANNNLEENGKSYHVDVYQREYDINWRMLVNDDLDALSSLPRRIAQGARRTEEHFATTFFVDANGPHASVYTVGNKNIINTTNGASVNNPSFSTATALQDAYKVLRAMVDPVTGEPIFIDVVHLVVPPAMEILARNLLAAGVLRFGALSDATGYEVGNWMAGKVQLHVNPYLPYINTTNGNTAWYLFADPGEDRPAIEIGYLRGFDQPAIYQKLPNMQRVGGGVDPTMGSFESGDISYKGMVVMGGVVVDPRMTVASTGTNT